MTDLTPFDFDGQAVRVVTIDDEPWFVATDVTAILGYSNGRMAVGSLPDRMKSSVTIGDGTPGNPNRAVISESGVYRLVMRSNLPAAERFQDWIAEDVLPAIRKTGQYGGAPALTDEQIVHQALQITSRKVQQLEAKIAADAPKVAYVDTYVADEDLLKLRTVAAHLGVQETVLRSLLVARRWIYAEQSTRWSNSKGQKETVNRYSAHADKKRYFRPVEVHDAPRFRGSEPMHTLKVTPAGAEAIARMLPRWLAGEDAA